jgi:hypothetical protein
LSSSVRYTENTEDVEVGDGLWATAGQAKLVRSMYDVERCTSLTEVVLPEDGTDVVISLRLTLQGGEISEAEAIITRDGDWLFDSDGFLGSADQSWDLLPEEQRTSRDDLIAAARAYYDIFNDPSVVVPFGDPCERLEGGTGPVGCTVGIPDGVVIGDRRFYADVEAGISAGIGLFGSDSAGLLDIHFYQMFSDEIRHVHSMTVDSSFSGTGWERDE